MCPCEGDHDRVGKRKRVSERGIEREEEEKKRKRGIEREEEEKKRKIGMERFRNSVSVREETMCMRVKTEREKG